MLKTAQQQHTLSPWQNVGGTVGYGWMVSDVAHYSPPLYYVASFHVRVVPVSVLCN